MGKQLLNRTFKDCVLSILAGFMIGIGGTMYLLAPDKVIGSALFSFGLITIVLQGYNLYTGKIGYIKTIGCLKMFHILLYNLIGTMLWSIIVKLCGLHINVSEIVLLKLSQSPIETLFRSIICGVLMFLAVDGYKKKQSLIILMLPVMIFILCGFEHCIANMFYFWLDGMSISKIYYLLINIIGNTVGGIGISMMNKFAS